MDHGQINHQVSIVSYMFWSIRKTIFWQNKTHLFASLKISSGVGCPTFATEQLEQWITAIFFPKASVHARTQGCLLIHENYKWTAAFPRFFGDELQRIFQNCLASNCEEGSIRGPHPKKHLEVSKVFKSNFARSIVPLSKGNDSRNPHIVFWSAKIEACI